MPTPEFITKIRAAAGHQLLWLPGVTVVVFNDRDEVLLGRRADTGKWALIAGMPEPGEQPADTAVRECFEETGVHCVPERVVLVEALAPMAYPNGDQCQFMDTTFRCRAVDGEAKVNDDESLDVRWFPLDNLPELADHSLIRIERALADAPTWFATPAPVQP